MKFAATAALSLFALGYAGAANAITIDGVYDAAYGAAKSIVIYDPNAPQGNFQTPGNSNHTTGYQIFLAEQGGSVYGYLQAFGPNSGMIVSANLTLISTALTATVRISALKSSITAPLLRAYLAIPGLLDFSLLPAPMAAGLNSASRMRCSRGQSPVSSTIQARCLPHPVAIWCCVFRRVSVTRLPAALPTVPTALASLLWQVPFPNRQPGQ